MYIYLIKYNGHVIATAKNDKFADKAIKKFMKNDNTMKKKLFEKEAVRFFGGGEDDT